MNIVAIIAARGNSKGIANKNIIDFCGKPLIYWTITQSLKSKYIVFESGKARNWTYPSGQLSPRILEQKAHASGVN